MIHDIKRCRVCHKPHKALTFTKLEQPGPDGRTHEAACPTNPEKRIPLWHVSCSEEKRDEPQGADQEAGE